MNKLIHLLFSLQTCNHYYKSIFLYNFQNKQYKTTYNNQAIPVNTMENLELRPNDRRAKNAISLIWVVMVVNLLVTLLDIWGDLIFGQEYNADYYDEGNIPLLIFAVIVGMGGVLTIGVSIISAVTFIMWFRRAYYNLHQTPIPLSYGEGWAAGAWFVPIMNLFVPYRIMKELYQKTNIIFQQNLKTCSIRLKTSNLAPWWTLWIITEIIDRIIFRIVIKGVEGPFVESLSIISAVLTFICGWITIKIIKEYSAVEPYIADAFKKDNYDLTHNTPLVEPPSTN